MKKLFIHILFLSIGISLLGQGSFSTNQNYIHTRTYTNESGTTYLDQVEYFDGLGRPIQTVQRGITPDARDLVSIQEYDAFGRESKAWLPGKVTTTNNGAFVDVEAAKIFIQMSNAGDQKPYSSPVYEASPLSRVKEQYGPGQDWYSKTTEARTIMKTEYMKNSSTVRELQCRAYEQYGYGTDSYLYAYCSDDDENEYYYFDEGYLDVEKRTYSDGLVQYRFKESNDMVILIRDIINGEFYDTYFVPDNNWWEKYSFILLPEASKALLPDSYLDDYPELRQYVYEFVNDYDFCAYIKYPGSNDWEDGQAYRSIINEFMDNGTYQKCVEPLYGVRYNYLANIGKSGTTWVDNDSLVCALYKTTDDRKVISLSRTANYPAGELSVTRLKDEDGNMSYEFTDKLGQVVLTRQINEGKRYDTNYIYDSYGNLKAVLPPEASDRLLNSSNWIETDANLMQYAYLYKYDDRNRCIAKKIPGCEWNYYVYDKADRLIFSQDGEQYNKSPKEWTFTIPDAFGRVVLTGTCTNSLDYSANPLGNIVVKATYNTGRTNPANSYTVTGVTLSAATVLSVNFYDGYEFLGITGVPNTADTQYTTETGYGVCYGDHQAANKHKNKGLLTGTLTAQMNADGTTGTTYLYSVMYYDNRARLIQTKSNNHLAGGLEKEYIAYNFTGQPTQRKHVHQATGKTTQTEVYTYTYDHAGRLLTTKHKLNTAAEVTLAENSYDELGRLKTNKKGGQANLNSTYAYNVRSWTKSINSPLFVENLDYTYNGNIKWMDWKQDNQTRKYTYTYDNLSRLKTAAYTGIGSEQYGTSYSYDKHGNIKTLQRYGKKDAGNGSTSFGLVDNLTMDHIGNQLT
ncbi:DUF6443 domain-containing protein, partial [Dysgonomonas reticulitermitis]